MKDLIKKIKKIKRFFSGRKGKRILYAVICLTVLTVTAVTGKQLGKEPDFASSIPQYAGSPYIPVHDNIPYFDPEQEDTESFEKYSSLDILGRCGTAFANLSRDTMPTEPRGKIGQIRPSGWHTVKYRNVVEDGYLYNRCHLIAWCLAGENANEKNLITGTRYMNVEGMLPFEEMVAKYLDETGNHVLYRVTPLFKENNLVASGVLMEALSVEDGGAGICFCVYCYNVQPGIEIDYRTGESHVVDSLKRY